MCRGLKSMVIALEVGGGVGSGCSTHDDVTDLRGRPVIEFVRLCCTNFLSFYYGITAKSREDEQNREARGPL